MRRAVILFILVSFLISCETTRSYNIKYKGEITPGKWLRKIPVEIKNAKETSRAHIQLYFPSGYVKGKNYRTIIALHSYNANEREWEINTNIEALANKYNFVIVCPDMKGSVYESKYYPETKTKWNIEPGGKFIGETLINFLNKNFAIAYKKSSTGILGVTAGAHGALLIASHNNGLFKAVAGISGYYDPTVMPNSRMVENVYGKYEKNKLRWENEDNVLKLAENLSGVKVYLYHGRRSDAFSVDQSRIMRIKLKMLRKSSSSYSITYNENKRGNYGWTYWKKAVPEIMSFFNKNLTE